MKPNQWLTLAYFHTSTPSQKMEMLLAQREALFQKRHELLGRQAMLEHQKRKLIEQQTAHELQSRLFWCKLRRAPLSEQREDE